MNEIKLDVRIRKQGGRIHRHNFDVVINGVHRSCTSPTDLTSFILCFLYPKVYDYSKGASRLWKNKIGNEQGVIVDIMLDNGSPMAKRTLYSEWKHRTGKSWKNGSFHTALSRLAKRHIIVKLHNERYKVTEKFRKRHPYVMMMDKRIK